MIQLTCRVAQWTPSPFPSLPSPRPAPSTASLPSTVRGQVGIGSVHVHVRVRVFVRVCKCVRMRARSQLSRASLTHRAPPGVPPRRSPCSRASWHRAAPPSWVRAAPLQWRALARTRACVVSPGLCALLCRSARVSPHHARGQDILSNL